MKKKLLLADDSITIQKVIAITFSSDDYLLTVVDNGDAALEKARSDRPDLILADVFMPGKNGYEVCAAVKQDPNLQGIPVLLLTGTFEPFDEGKARAAGADKWIAKPFESQSLIDCIENLLAGAAGSAPKAPAPAPPVMAAAPPPVRPVPAPSVAVAPAPAPAPAVAPVTAAAPPVTSVAPPVAPAVVPSMVAEPDPWGDPGAIDLDLSELGGAFGGAEPPPIIPAASDDDLWGAVALEEEEVAATSISAAGEESWSLDDAIDMSAPVSAFDTEMQISTADQDIWGGLEAESVGSAAGQIELDEFPTWEAESEPLSMSDVEILEEEDIEPAQVPVFDEPIFSPGPGGPLEMDLVSDFGGDPMSGELQWDESALTAVPSAHGERAPSAPAAVPSQTIAPTPTPTPTPVIAQAPMPVAAPVAPPAAAAGVEQRVAALSEAELEAIVQRVAGLVIERIAGALVEKVAWEVVPDLAESLIKEEIRKIKEAV